MAPKKISPTVAPGDPARRRTLVRILWLVAALIFLAALAIYFLGAGAPTGLPLMPDLSTRGNALQSEVRAADAKAHSWFSWSVGVADLGRLYHVNRFEREAAACWTILSRKQPREGRWPYYLADLARNAADNDGMSVHLQEALRRAPTYATAWLRLADAAFKTARFDAAGKAYRRRLELVPGDPYARFGLIRLALQLGRRDEGMRALEELVRDVPGFSSAQNLYAEILARDGDEKGAAHHRWLGTIADRFREADDSWLLELRPYCYDSYQLAVWGSQEEQTKQPARARELFERAIAVAPGDPLAYAELGQLLLNLGEREKAREVLERGVRLAPFNEKVWLRYSAALRDLSRSQEALEHDRRGLAQAPDSFEFLNSLGQSQVGVGQLAEAEQSFRAALRLSPNSPNPQVNLGIVYLRTGRRAEAQRILESALVLNPGYPKLLVTLGQLALEDHRLDEAERLLRPFFERYPGNSKARAMFAQVFFERAVSALSSNDFPAAERWCAAGLDAVPDSAELLGIAGSIHLQNGDVPKALEAMEACQRLRPGDPRAMMPLVVLYQKLNRPAEARRVLIEAREWLKRNGGAEHVPQVEALLQKLQ